MSECKLMFRWGMWKKDGKAETRRRDPQPEPIEDEWQFLRAQPDYDEDSMASVHSRPEVGSLPEAPMSRALSVGEARETPGPALCEPRAERPALPTLVLEVLGLDETRQVRVSDALLIGRTISGERMGTPASRVAPDLDLVEDDAVSRRHARIERRNGRFWIADLASTNGTFHNGSALIAHVEVPLRVGDEIELGEFSLLRVVALEDDAALTDEDHQLSDMLGELMDDEPTPMRPAPMRSVPMSSYEICDHRPMSESLDLLDLALELGEADGLLTPVAVGVGACATLPSPGTWRLHDPRGAELPLL